MGCIPLTLEAAKHALRLGGAHQTSAVIIWLDICTHYLYQSRLQEAKEAARKLSTAERFYVSAEDSAGVQCCDARLEDCCDLNPKVKFLTFSY